MVGHEQGGRRPALVLSRDPYSRKVGLCVSCLITAEEKGYPFEVQLPDGMPVRGVILADHIRRLDWRARQSELIGPCPLDIVEEVLVRVAALID